MRLLKLLVLVGSLFCIQAVIAGAVSDDWKSVADTSAQAPTSQKNNDLNFWFEEIEGDHTDYWRFIEAYDTLKESVANISRCLVTYVADYRVGKVKSAVGGCFNFT